MSLKMRVAALLAAGSFALSGVAAARDVVLSFKGCTMPGVEAGCVVVETGGKTYNISSAKPRPGLYRAIAGRGLVSGDMSHCMQGTLLKDVHWSYIRMPCPKAAARRS